MKKYSVTYNAMLKHAGFDTNDDFYTAVAETTGTQQVVMIQMSTMFAELDYLERQVLENLELVATRSQSHINTLADGRVGDITWITNAANKAEHASEKMAMVIEDIKKLTVIWKALIDS